MAQDVDTSQKIAISILGKEYTVDRDETLIFALMDLGFMRYTNKFCWNGECENCMVYLKINPDSDVCFTKACQTKLADGLSVVQMPSKFYKVR
jgi:aerobic-type carbon monoxide dehydrogenase small subunit (CoxS/CutS family)